MRPLLVLRPEPGASTTARRATERGLHPVVAPLFAVHASEWTPPDPSLFDVVLFTSANAPRLAGANLARYRHLPAFAVGSTTAAAARNAGFADIVTGSRDAEHLLAASPRDARILHLCGAYGSAPPRPMHAIPVYASEAVAALPSTARDAIPAGAVALLHSPRAAALFASFVAPADRGKVAIIAISSAAADAAGPGWQSIAAASHPTDSAMLEIARILCENHAS